MYDKFFVLAFCTGLFLLFMRNAWPWHLKTMYIIFRSLPYFFIKLGIYTTTSHNKIFTNKKKLNQISLACIFFINADSNRNSYNSFFFFWGKQQIHKKITNFFSNFSLNNLVVFRVFFVCWRHILQKLLIHK